MRLSLNTASDYPESLQSAVSTSPADALLSQAISATLHAPPQERADLFEQLSREIVIAVAAEPDARPWTCSVYRGTDGSRIFRGGVGHSIVIDHRGRVWRARSYEDFDTEYKLIAHTCEIASLTPRYEQMREYRQA